MLDGFYPEPINAVDPVVNVILLFEENFTDGELTQLVEDLWIYPRLSSVPVKDAEGENIWKSVGTSVIPELIIRKECEDEESGLAVSFTVSIISSHLSSHLFLARSYVEGLFHRPLAEGTRRALLPWWEIHCVHIQPSPSGTAAPSSRLPPVWLVLRIHHAVGL